MNSQTEQLVKVDSCIADVEIQFVSAKDNIVKMDKGIQSAITRINKDLEALDKRINRRHIENKDLATKLVQAEEKYHRLMDRFEIQEGTMVRLLLRMTEVEGQRCHCKGKDKTSLELVGSPIILSRGDMFELAVPEETFHTPPGSDLSSNPSSSSVGGTLIKIVEDPIIISVEKVVMIPVVDPSYIQVCRQRTIPTGGSPKGHASPYPSSPCCHSGSRSPTHRHGSLCLQAMVDSGEGDV